MAQKSMKCLNSQTILIGLDGISFTVPDYLMESGTMPFMESGMTILMESGMTILKEAKTTLFFEELISPNGGTGSVASLGGRSTDNGKYRSPFTVQRTTVNGQRSTVNGQPGGRA